MKIHEQPEPEFKPVTVTLETKEELKSFLALVNASGNDHTKFVNEHLPYLETNPRQQLNKPFTQRDYQEVVKAFKMQP